MDPEIDVISGDATRMEGYFAKFLARKSVITNASIKKTLTTARKRHKIFENSTAIKRRLNNAWGRLINSSGEQENLVLHFAHSQNIEAGEGLVRAFLKDNDYSLFNQVAVTPKQTHPKPISFTFEDKGEEQTINVKSFAEIFRKLSALLYELNPDNFSQKIIGIERAWVSAASDAKKGHESIGDSGVAINTGGNAKAIENRCRKLVASLGYKPESLTIQFAEI